MKYIIETIRNFIFGDINLASGNRAEINRRLRIIQGVDENPCRALMVVKR